jgi:hypothetical protein
MAREGTLLGANSPRSSGRSLRRCGKRSIGCPILHPSHRQAISRPGPSLSPAAGLTPASSEIEVFIRKQTLPGGLMHLAMYQPAAYRLSGNASTEPEAGGDPRVQLGVLRPQPGAPDGEKGH